jgi:hypothetical protein
VAIVSPPPRSSVISSAARRCVSVSVIGWGTYGGIIHSGNAAVLYIAQIGAYYPNLIHGAKVIIFRDITKLFRHYFLIIFPLPFCMSLCHSDQDSSTTLSRSRLGLSIHPAPLSDGKSNFKDGIFLPLFPLFTAPLHHFHPPKSKNDVILAYLILILRKILLEK